MKLQDDFYQKVQLEVGTLSTQVKNHIQNAIMKGDLKPGEMIVESLVAEKLGISRAPVREALRMLEAKGLVNIIPRKGVFVSELSVKELKEIYEIRLNLELLALKSAYQNEPEIMFSEMEQSLTRQETAVNDHDVKGYLQENIHFHDIFINNSGNSYLVTLLQNIEELTLRYRASSMNITGRIEKSFQDHLLIYSYLKANNLDQALLTLENHITSSEKSLQNQLKK